MLLRGRIDMGEAEESEEEVPPVYLLGLALPVESLVVPVEAEDARRVVLLYRYCNQSPETRMKMMHDLLWKTMAMIPEVSLLTA